MTVTSGKLSLTGAVLLVDDDTSLTRLLALTLSESGLEVTCTKSGNEALLEIAGRDFDAIVTDINMPGISGLEFCLQVAENRPGTPVLVITGQANVDVAVAAMRVGAHDFMTKPFPPEALGWRLKRLLEDARTRTEVRRLRQLVESGEHFDDLIGASSSMKRVYALLDRMADTDVTALITGESGTGKEVVARILHNRGLRRDGRFVAINCAAVSEQLLEAELFGHTKGAFTDAKNDRPGLFVTADGGTLFLDEIGDMPLALQPKLLRALEERKVRPVGSDKEIEFDVRVVAATNRDLETAVADGRFREDLFFRVNVIRIALPPLRARGRDILILADHFLKYFAEQTHKLVRSLSTPVADRLLGYDWPGNVRELRNCIEHAVTLAQFDQLLPDDLPEKLRNHRPSHLVFDGDHPEDLVSMDEVERRYVLRVLDAVKGNKTMAAGVLGLNRKTLYRKLERYGVA